VFLHDELDLLELRLDLLDDVVDRVLVVEGDRTFDGAPKTPVLPQHQERFARWWPKLTHSVATLTEPGTGSAWDRENDQRAHLRSLLVEAAAPDDLLLIGDVDELPDPTVVRVLPRLVGSEPLRLLMEHCIFFANWRALVTWGVPFVWDNGPLACRLDHLDSPMVRVILGEPHLDWDGFVQHQVPAAGVHVSGMGGRAAIDRKLDITAQQEWNRSEVRDHAHLQRCIANRVHFQAWPLEVVPEPELHRVVRRLHEVRPDLFDFDPPPALPGRRAFLAYTWLRNRGALGPVGRLLERRPGLVTGAGRPLFGLADRVLQTGRRRKLRAPYWKAPVDVPWPGMPTDRAGRPTATGPY
jgi:beta-1,4-mannosyl-glycoprotein beta-1,4-N-acetylglucosaminyltransferase